MPLSPEAHVIKIYNHTACQVLVVLLDKDQSGKDLQWGTAVCIMSGAWHAGTLNLMDSL